MSKKEKIWLCLSLSLFLIPELLFSIISLSVANIVGYDFNPISSFFIENKELSKHPIFLLTMVAIEFFGVLSLFILSIKKRKILFAVLFFIALICLFFIFAVGRIFMTANFIM